MSNGWKRLTWGIAIITVFCFILIIYGKDAYSNVSFPLSFQKRETCPVGTVEFSVEDNGKSSTPSSIPSVTNPDPVTSYFSTPVVNRLNICVPPLSKQSNILNIFTSAAFNCSVSFTNETSCQRLKDLGYDAQKDMLSKKCAIGPNKICENAINQLIEGDQITLNGNNLTVNKRKLDLLKDKPIKIKLEFNKKLKEVFGADYSLFFNETTNQIDFDKVFLTASTNELDQLNSLERFIDTYNSVPSVEEEYKTEVIKILESPEPIVIIDPPSPDNPPPDNPPLLPTKPNKKNEQPKWLLPVIIPIIILFLILIGFLIFYFYKKRNSVKIVNEITNEITPVIEPVIKKTKRTSKEIFNDIKKRIEKASNEIKKEVKKRTTKIKPNK